MHGDGIAFGRRAVVPSGVAMPVVPCSGRSCSTAQLVQLAGGAAALDAP